MIINPVIGDTVYLNEYAWQCMNEKFFPYSGLFIGDFETPWIVDGVGNSIAIRKPDYSMGLGVVRECLSSEPAFIPALHETSSLEISLPRFTFCKKGMTEKYDPRTITQISFFNNDSSNANLLSIQTGDTFAVGDTLEIYMSEQKLNDAQVEHVYEKDGRWFLFYKIIASFPMTTKKPIPGANLTLTSR